MWLCGFVPTLKPLKQPVVLLMQKLQGPTWILSQLNLSGTSSLGRSGLAPATTAACCCSPCFQRHDKYTITNSAKLITRPAFTKFAVSELLCALQQKPLSFCEQNMLCPMLQASLADDQSELKQAAYASELMRQGAEAGADGVSVVGLRNATGEYNCFLNVIIQCLWHCHDFRRQVMKWEPAAYEVSVSNSSYLTGAQHQCKAPSDACFS